MSSGGYENMKFWTCPKCGQRGFREVGDLVKCDVCGYGEKPRKGLIPKTGYLQKCIEDVTKFDVDHGVDGEHEPGIDNMIYHALCMAGEAGEVANVIKKIWRDGDNPALRAHLAEEIVDLTIFLSLLVESAEIDFDKAWLAKHEELYLRWSNKQISRRKTKVVHVQENERVVSLHTEEFICNTCRRNISVPCGFIPLNPRNCGGLNGEMESGYIPNVSSTVREPL